MPDIGTLICIWMRDEAWVRDLVEDLERLGLSTLHQTRPFEMKGDRGRGKRIYVVGSSFFGQPATAACAQSLHASGEAVIVVQDEKPMQYDPFRGLEVVVETNGGMTAALLTAIERVSHTQAA